MDPRTDRLIAMRRECAENPTRCGGKLCDSCSRLEDKSCGWWFTMRVPNIPPEGFENHCANYRMGSGRTTDILLTLEASLGGKIEFPNPVLISPDSYFHCLFCSTRFRIGDGHRCKTESKNCGSASHQAYLQELLKKVEKKPMGDACMLVSAVLYGYSRQYIEAHGKIKLQKRRDGYYYTCCVFGEIKLFEIDDNPIMVDCGESDALKRVPKKEEK